MPFHVRAMKCIPMCSERRGNRGADIRNAVRRPNDPGAKRASCRRVRVWALMLGAGRRRDAAGSLPVMGDLAQCRVEGSRTNKIRLDLLPGGLARNLDNGNHFASAPLDFQLARLRISAPPSPVGHQQLFGPTRSRARLDPVRLFRAARAQEAGRLPRQFYYGNGNQLLWTSSPTNAVISLLRACLHWGLQISPGGVRMWLGARKCAIHDASGGGPLRPLPSSANAAGAMLSTNYTDLATAAWRLIAAA